MGSARKGLGYLFCTTWQERVLDAEPSIPVLHTTDMCDPGTIIPEKPASTRWLGLLGAGFSVTIPEAHARIIQRRMRAMIHSVKDLSPTKSWLSKALLSRDPCGAIAAGHDRSRGHTARRTSCALLLGVVARARASGEAWLVDRDSEGMVLVRVVRASGVKREDVKGIGIRDAIRDGGREGHWSN